MTRSATKDNLANNVVHFARILRNAGLPISTASTIEALDAIQLAGLTSRADVYWALHTTLIKRREHREIFDQAFHVFWRDPRLLDRMMAMMLPELQTPENEQNQTSRRLAEALMKQRPPANDIPEPELDMDARETLSATEILRTKDFEQMSLIELAEAKNQITKLQLQLNTLRTRRSKPSNTGALIDMRATLRATLRHNDMINLKRKTPRFRSPPLVILCDISGSMSIYARVFLHFVHTLSQHRSHLHTFLFGTRLTHVTRQLRHKDVDEALNAVSESVEDWDGGTRIGETLHEFNKHWARRVLAQNATVLLITDGLDRDAGQGLSHEMERLHKSSRHLIWLNPLLRYNAFEPKASGIKAMMPHVDAFRPVHNVASLAGLVEALNDGPQKRKAA
ncbi:MAG: VWA domain-containing protein [Parvibaculum sp.]